jgi:hypothetical protein
MSDNRAITRAMKQFDYHMRKSIWGIVLFSKCAVLSRPETKPRLKTLKPSSHITDTAILLRMSYVFEYNTIGLKAMLHGAIFLATCNAILLLRYVKLPNTSLHYTPLMFSQHIENSSQISLINISIKIIVN